MDVRLVEKSSQPGVKESTEKKFYAVPSSQRPLPPLQLARHATQDSSLSPYEFLSGVHLYCRESINDLLAGRTVEIPEIGSLRISFQSEGVSQPEEFRASSMIHHPRIIFTPKKELRDRLDNELSFNVNGVRAGGHDYVSIREYRLQTGTTYVPSSSPSTPEPGGNTGSGGSTPPGDGGNPDGIE